MKTGITLERYITRDSMESIDASFAFMLASDTSVIGHGSTSWEAMVDALGLNAATGWTNAGLDYSDYQWNASRQLDQSLVTFKDGDGFGVIFKR